MEKVNYIIGVLGKKGSGKSYLVKSMLSRIPRLIIIDPLREYSGVIFNDWRDVVEYIHKFKSGRFRAVFRPTEGREDESIGEVLDVVNDINNYTLVMEEVDYVCDPWTIHPELERLVKYGRHFRRNLIWISRNAAEVNRDLTRQSDTLVTFRQTEPIDLKYLRSFSFSKDPETLEKYEFATSGDIQMFTLLTGKSK